MPEPIFVEGRVYVPEDAIAMRAVRASGPGGQNLNKVASKVELRVDLDRITGLSSDSRQRLLRLVAKRMDNEGRLLVTSQRTRDQHRNRADARQKIHDWIALALRQPKNRVATSPRAATIEKRIREKKLHSRRKEERRAVRSGGDE